MMKLFDELKYRGLINDVTSPQLEEKLNNGGLTFYIGTDPTGDSPVSYTHLDVYKRQRLCHTTV